MPPHPLTNFQIQKYYQNDSKFNGFYSTNKLPKIKGRAYLINLEQYESIGSHWIALYVNDDNVTYFDSLGVSEKTLVLCLICSKPKNEDKKYLKMKNELKY